MPVPHYTAAMVDAPSPRDTAHRDGCAGAADCDDTQVIARTLRWMERAVIGLNLCPFAKAVHAKGQVHVAVSHASGADGVLADLQREMHDLVALDSAVRDTTLLVLPHALTEFLEFNDFLDPAEALLDALGLHGVLQIASFHPRYQFAGTEPDDITNFSNRSPWPTLHLLREDSIARAVDAFPDPEAIFGANMKTLQQLGVEGWARLDVGPHPAEDAAPSVASKARS
ncbi:MAG: hypothetical protein RL087_1166 [Pseudomonadota bacterium]